MYKLYEYPGSGNCYKLSLAMSQLDIPFERETVDILQGESRSDAFLAINPNGRVPVLRTPEGDHLPESNAALWYLASGTPLLPEGRMAQARVLQWMFFEQYSHEPFIATSRFWMHILGAADEYREQIEQKRPGGYAALGVMEQHLSANDFFLGEQYSIADIALYAYTHVAGEGGFSLADFPAVRGWLDRVATTPGYVPIDTL